MITAIVTAKCEIGKVHSVSEALTALEGVAEVYSVSGEFDVLAIIKESAGLIEDMVHVFGKKGTLDPEKVYRAVDRIDGQVKRGADLLLDRLVLAVIKVLAVFFGQPLELL